MGATGYVGSRLVPELLGRGFQVVAATRQPGRRIGFPWADAVETREIDVERAVTLDGAFDDIDAAYYLVHGLEHRDFRSRDLAAAREVRLAAARSGLPRLVYLSGIVPEGDPEDLSEHLLSRLEVEQELLETGVALSLRAAMVIGAGSASFEAMRQISRRVPLLQPIPAWMWGTRLQPVSISDVVHYLAEAIDPDEAGEHWYLVGSADLAGPEVVTYRALLATYAEVVRQWRMQLPVWGAPRDIVAPVAAALTDLDTSTAEALMRSLEHDMVGGLDVRDLLGDPARPLLGVREAIARAVAAAPSAGLGEDGASPGGDPQRASAGDPEWARA